MLENFSIFIPIANDYICCIFSYYTYELIIDPLKNTLAKKTSILTIIFLD